MHGGKMDDDLGIEIGDGASHAVGVADVDLAELGLRMEPRAAPAREVVERGDPFSGCDEPLDEVATDEAGSARDKDAPRHLTHPSHVETLRRPLQSSPQELVVER